MTGWLDNTWPNHGMALVAETVGVGNYGLCYSAEYSGEFAPKLVVRYVQTTAVEGSTWGNIKRHFN